MADQKTMNEHRQNGHQEHSPAADVGSNVADFSHDLISLTELQIQLFAVDVREGTSHSVIPVVLIVAGLILALGAVPVLLLGVAWALVHYAELSQEVALLATGLTALVIAGLMAWVGWRRMQSALSIFTRSQHELKENIYWIKQALKRRSTRRAAASALRVHRD